LYGIFIADTKGKNKARKRRLPTVKKIIRANDSRLKVNRNKSLEKQQELKEKLIQEVPIVSSALFFKYNTQLGPPYYVLLDTNFINYSIQNKIEIITGMMDCLYAKCIPCVTDCVIGELEKLGKQYRVALRIAKDPRFERIICTHAGTYADDCIVRRVTQHKTYIVATCDRDLKRRIRKIPGVPVMYVKEKKNTPLKGCRML